MKKPFFIIAMIGLLAGLVSAQGPSSPYSISVAPVSFAISTFDLGLERQMTGRSSLMATGSFGFRDITLWESVAGDYLQYGGKLAYRGYLGKDPDASGSGLWGPYASGWISASMAKVDVTLQQKEYTMVKSQGLMPGVELGWKFPLIRRWPNLTMDLSVGGGYKFGTVSGRYAEKSRSLLFKDNGIVPVFGFRVAYTPGDSNSNSKPKTKQPATDKAISQEIAFHNQYTPEKRKAIEKALKAKHVFFGRADGVFGEDTIQAIKLFQQKNGLKVDGKAGKATLERLGV